MNLSMDVRKKLQEFKYFENFDWSFECGILMTGSSFGEQAMIGDGKRSVTIKAKTDCFLAELDKEDFKKVLKKIEAKKVLQ